MTKAGSQNEHSNLIWYVVFAIAVFTYFFGLNIPLVGPDEPRYTQVAVEMFQRSDWVTTRLAGYNWFEKPALLYWLQIASFHVFGISEFAARFGSALFGLGTIAAVWMFAKAGFKTSLAANITAAIAASSIGLIVFSRGASFDIILTFPMTVTLVSFFIFDQTDKENSSRRNLALVIFYIFVGVGLLAKGLVGIVFPAAIIVFYHLLSWRFPEKPFLLSFIWGGLITFGVAALWYWPMYQRNGWEFIDHFFLQHHFQRYTSNKYLHPQPFHFFFWVLPLMTVPWLPFFAAGLWKFIRSVFKASSARFLIFPLSAPPILIFAFAWMLFPLLFFTFSGSKLPGYILPALPALIVFTAHFILRKSQSSQGWIKLTQSLAVATFVVIIALLIFVVPRYAETDSVKAMIDKANAAGYDKNEVLSLHTISHNAEYYAAGRLLRDKDGKQQKLLGPDEVLHEIRNRNGEAVLVIVPVEWAKDVTEVEKLDAEIIDDNGHLMIAAVRERK